MNIGLAASRSLRQGARSDLMRHVARQHEADIQLLERAARVAGTKVVCLNDPITADRWARLATSAKGL